MAHLITNKLDEFENINLSQMSEIRLMKRIDKKFVFPMHILPELLSMLIDDYFVQEINGKRSSNYTTLYYDTTDFEMFRNHQNGKLCRLKVRIRSYVDSNLSFLEIKKKSNKGVTRKIRIDNQNNQELIIGNDPVDFLSNNSPYNKDIIEPKIWSIYNRITLVNKLKTERLTIDYNLCFKKNSNQQQILLPGMVIMEIKREQASISPVMNSLNQLRIKPKGMSKYCLGVALTENSQNLKLNTFKSKLREINKITTIQYV